MRRDIVTLNEADSERNFKKIAESSNRTRKRISYDVGSIKRKHRESEERIDNRNCHSLIKLSSSQQKICEKMLQISKTILELSNKKLTSLSGTGRSPSEEYHPEAPRKNFTDKMMRTMNSKTLKEKL